MLKIAHRGDTKSAPENTLAAMEAAIKGGADAVEIDVRTCKTGEAIVIHDHSVNRTTNGQGDISQMTLQQVRNLQTEGGHKVPTLAEVLNLIDQRCMVFIELKNVAAAKPVGELVKHFVETKMWTYPKMPVISALHQSIVLAREYAPQMHTGATLRTLPESLAAAGEYTQSQYLLPDTDVITAELVKDAHDKGLRVVAWNCEREDAMQKAKDLKVDGIIAKRYQKI